MHQVEHQNGFEGGTTIKSIQITYDKIASMYKKTIKNLNTNMLPQKVADVLDILKEQQFSKD